MSERKLLDSKVASCGGYAADIEVLSDIEAVTVNSDGAVQVTGFSPIPRSRGVEFAASFHSVDGKVSHLGEGSWSSGVISEIAGSTTRGKPYEAKLRPSSGEAKGAAVLRVSVFVRYLASPEEPHSVMEPQNLEFMVA